MTGRERLRACFRHEETDRPPIDFSGHRSSGISAIAYGRLRRFLGLDPKVIRVYDPIQQLAIVHEDVLKRFAVDTIELGRGFACADTDWADWVLPDGTACQMPAWAAPRREQGQWVLRSKTGRIIARMPDGALYFEQTYWPYAERKDADFSDLRQALAESMWTAIASPPGQLLGAANGWDLLAEGARKLRKSTDRAIVALFGGNLLEVGQFLFRNDNFYMLLAEEPDRAHAFLDAVVELHLVNLDKFLDAVSASVDVIVFGDDLGMQTGPQISPAMYREFFKPRHAKMWRHVKERSGLKINLHCCGGVRQLLPDLIEAGLDAINPVQITCEGMDGAELKQEFGRDLVFWGGGCDTRTILPKGRPEEVADHVRRQVRILGKGGGFVFQQVHNIMADVPPENIVAMFDAAAR